MTDSRVTYTPEGYKEERTLRIQFKNLYSLCLAHLFYSIDDQRKKRPTKT